MCPLGIPGLSGSLTSRRKDLTSRCNSKRRPIRAQSSNMKFANRGSPSPMSQMFSIEKMSTGGVSSSSSSPSFSFSVSPSSFFSSAPPGASFASSFFSSAPAPFVSATGSCFMSGKNFFSISAKSSLRRRTFAVQKRVPLQPLFMTLISAPRRSLKASGGKSLAATLTAFAISTPALVAHAPRRQAYVFQAVSFVYCRPTPSSAFPAASLSWNFGTGPSDFVAPC
mmetsp:Transcript_63448/g.178572  ORF Transcript_63448/g.178572 Transcript_63448/m.178572 type:complete len:225 (+) Transcript_63448:703-1377(+)